MVAGKNPKFKAKNKKKKIDLWSRKHWYQVRVPSYFQKPFVCWTPVTRTIGEKKEETGLMGRVFKASVADLANPEDAPYMNMSFKVQGLRERECLTDFYGMQLTRDMVCGLLKKWVSLIEGSVDVRTTDGYVFRVFCIGLTKRDPSQKSTKAARAKSAQIRRIRKIMADTMEREIKKLNLKELVQTLMKESIAAKITKLSSRVYPMENVYVRKVKLIRAPKVDRGALDDLHRATVQSNGDAYGGPDLGEGEVDAAVAKKAELAAEVVAEAVEEAAE